MSRLQKYSFHGIYDLINLVEEHINLETEFWNYNEDYFIKHSAKFSKDTLLHQYIVITALNFYTRDFRKNEDFYDDEYLSIWYEKFDIYNLNIQKIVEDDDREDSGAYEWFLENEDKFCELFSEMSEEAFYVLFNNRKLLLKFNKIVSTHIYEKNVIYPNEYMTEKGTIKRCHIPVWVKKAVFHRDKGRCVFCNTDLTNLINHYKKSNFDHIVPLDMYGVNDPCNIQLTCETCNKSKSNVEVTTSDKYFSWW